MVSEFPSGKWRKVIADTCMHKVASVVLYGDPSFVKDLSWDQGTANNTSFFPRQDNTACDPVADQRKI